MNAASWPEGRRLKRRGKAKSWKHHTKCMEKKVKHSLNYTRFMRKSVKVSHNQSFNFFVQIFEKPKMSFIIVNFQDGHSIIKNPIR